MPQNPRIVLFSDIHIGINAATNWYQRAIHEPYLLAAFEYIQRQASSIQELVVVGDLVDQWTYEPSRRPPSFADIAAANPQVFGGVVDGQRIPGALGAAVEALEGRVTYVGGNHDMAVTAKDLTLIRDSKGRSPRFVNSLLYEPPAGKGQVVCTHGHNFSLLNAPDYIQNPRNGLPFAHFITRMAALWSLQQLSRMPAGSTAASLPGGGDPTGWPLAKDALKELLKDLEHGRSSLSDVVLSALLDVTGQSRDLTFEMLDGTRLSVADVVKTYPSILKSYEETASKNKNVYGSFAGEFALAEVDALNNITHFAKRLGEDLKYPVVVMGHTHVPVDEDEHQLFMAESLYSNCGFNCPSEPDMKAHNKRRYCTFTEVEIDEAASRFIISTRYVTDEGGSYQVAPQPLTPPKSIAMRKEQQRRTPPGSAIPSSPRVDVPVAPAVASPGAGPMRMNRLASPIEEIRPHYTAVVIGSGYGGSILASRLSRAGQSVCVLERGRERQPGEFPNTVLEATENMQLNMPSSHVGSRTGMFDFHCNPDINVLVGCGLGGTSLINANVSIRAEARVFDNPRWPLALRGEKSKELEAGYSLAEEMLKPQPYPDTRPKLAKLEAMRKSAEAMGHKFYRTNINVTFEDGPNAAGVFQKACNNCGDCCSGCNVGAKNTVLMNYLPDAKRHGAEIYCETSVRYVERSSDGKWLVHYQVLDTGREKFDAPLLTVSADIVVLAAGTLGSTEILLRSKEKGLPVSDQVGKGFSGNGDVLGFAYNNEAPIQGIGFGTRSEHEAGEVGPTITSIIDMRNQEKVEDDLIMEEGAIPGALAPVLPAMLSAAADLEGTNTAPGLVVQQELRKVDSAVLGAYHGAVRNTQTYLVMGHDGSDGAMKLEGDRLRIDWAGVGKRPIFETVDKRLMESTQALQGIYTRDPVWEKLLGKSLITVHPLGGCNMADSAEQGVVNHENKVFSSNTGETTYEGLYVCDGSVVPTSLGVNPLLTISAISERCAVRLAAERGWTIDYSKKGPMPLLSNNRKPGIRFTESMKGFFAPSTDMDYVAAAARGEKEGSSFEFILTIVSEDVDAMMKQPDHSARMVGTVRAPALSDKPLTANQGVFNLFVQDPNEADTRRMKYRMMLTADDGRTFFFTGFKIVTERSITNMWHDTTTLYITVYEGKDESGKVLGRGVLKIAPEDFMHQLTTMDVFNAKDAAERLKLSLEFGKYFAGVLFEYYGGILAPLQFVDTNAPPRKRRPLRAPAPHLFGFKTPDGVDLVLTRYQSGGKGPVMLAHGLGVSSRIFSTDTIHTNLLEYLCAHGYDVWLLDYRASTLLPASKAQYTADQIATQDWPAAVAKVREVTGAADIQVIAHCYGSTTFTMAMLAGLQGVRSAVCSQISTHVETPTMVSLKSGLHLPQLLDFVGVKSLTTEAEKGEGFFSKLYDRALAAYPVGKNEHCDSAVCHRISFIYSLLYQHEQLNQLTHDSLHELFGEATVTALEGLATMVNKGHVVDAHGEDVYLPHLERMAIPIRFIHGERNQCFLPASTEKTLQVLSERNGAALYSRVVIPDYGHIDCIFGKNAAQDVYGRILEHLEQTQAAEKKDQAQVPAGKESVA